MSFRAVVFDLDGTLLDTLEDIGGAANRVLVEHGFPPHLLGSYREYIGEGVVRLVQRILPDKTHDEAIVQACVEAYKKEYARSWNVHTAPYPGVPELLDGLAARGLKLAVLSNKPDLFTQQCVREFLANWNFGVILGASDAFPRKPNPASALETARQMQVTPAECLYVGDSGVDMQTALAAGMYAVGVLWGFRGKTELQRDGAQVLIARPVELLAWFDQDHSC